MFSTNWSRDVGSKVISVRRRLRILSVVFSLGRLCASCRPMRRETLSVFASLGLSGDICELFILSWSPFFLLLLLKCIYTIIRFM